MSGKGDEEVFSREKRSNITDSKWVTVISYIHTK